VAGGIVIAIILLLFPVLVVISGLVAAVILGAALNRDAAIRNEGSELLDLNT
jgi:hypothetical protein